MWKWEAEGQAKAVVVIIHSAFEHHRWYAWLIEKLRVEGHHVVMGDLPGHGEDSKYSRVHDESINKYLVYIKHLMQNAVAYELPVFVIGQGLGGTLAIEFLKKKSIECAGLILTSPWLHLKKNTNLLTNAITSLGTIASSKKISLEFDKKMLTGNMEGYNEINDSIPYHSNVTVRWYKDVQQLTKNITAEQESHLTLPILLMTAKQDKITDPLAAKKWLMNQGTSEMQYKEWTNSHHNLFHDNEREEVFIYKRDFINNVIRSLGYIVN
ncbi:alpha/beta hydrolase [Lysinibacillus telephonicus]|uniref:Alpha/beta hydrolase n=1 Tax=Lysinibacillus telephonicus TaxID=1714840 RepID=A0A3S0HMT2_9BACI|nr:alpha/beta hydrolase [Lysinibacillus telephonicus]RTQ93356.1 alpha/beta hydrolase [Lysinibacillus telephonicus]